MCCKKGSSILAILACSFFLWYATMTGFGCYFLTDCPKEPMIPAYLIVVGIASSLLLMSSMWLTLNSYDSLSIYPACQIVFAFYIVLLIFSLVWRIAGSVFIFRFHVSGDVSLGSNDCLPLLFWFAFVAAIVDWVFAVPVYFGLIYSPWKKHQNDG